FGDLAAFASAIILGMIAFGVAAESISRLFFPVHIEYRSALMIAAVGLGVNLASASILKDHNHEHGHDHNLRAAYLHVLADAGTSVLAIIALGAGLLFGLRWFDPAVGIAGALV